MQNIQTLQPDLGVETIVKVSEGKAMELFKSIYDNCNNFIFAHLQYGSHCYDLIYLQEQ